MKLTSRGRAKLDMQMTSMIDVVFLLLIFFMVTSSFQKTERELDPAVKVERKAGSQAQDLAPAIVEVVRGVLVLKFKLRRPTLWVPNTLCRWRSVTPPASAPRIIFVCVIEIVSASSPIWASV
jgi:hypothetical protein